MNTARQKKTALTICIVLVFITFASLFYIVKEENHDCTGEDCPICVCLHQAEQVLKNLGAGKSEAQITGMIQLFVSFVLSVCYVMFCATSLVSQKVRLND